MNRVLRWFRRARVAPYPLGQFSVGLIMGLLIPIPVLVLVCGTSVLVRGTPERDIPLPTLDTVEVRNGTLAGSRLVTYYGPISRAGNALLLRRIEHTPRDRALWIEMNSGGGEVPAAFDMVDYVNSHGVGVSVGTNAQCASACVLVYANAARRFAPVNSYFGFHYKTRTWPLFAFGRLSGEYQHVYPMTGDMDLLGRNVPGQTRSLAAFFKTCSRGDPSASHKGVYLSYKQIEDVVRGQTSPRCDDVADQDANWFGGQVTAAYAVARWLRR